MRQMADSQTAIGADDFKCRHHPSVIVFAKAALVAKVWLNTEESQVLRRRRSCLGVKRLQVQILSSPLHIPFRGSVAFGQRKKPAGRSRRVESPI